MSRRISISRKAALDLTNIRRWLRQPGAGHKARLRLSQIRAAIDDLRIQPTLWAMGDVRGVRERAVSGYRILYVLDPELDSEANAGDVTVVRVFGPGQDRSEI